MSQRARGWERGPPYPGCTRNIIFFFFFLTGGVLERAWVWIGGWIWMVRIKVRVRITGFLGVFWFHVTGFRVMGAFFCDFHVALVGGTVYKFCRTWRNNHDFQRHPLPHPYRKRARIFDTCIWFDRRSGLWKTWYCGAQNIFRWERSYGIRNIRGKSERRHRDRNLSRNNRDRSYLQHSWNRASL